jgi:hypothetical protein
MLERWQGQDLLPLPDVARSVGLDRNSQHYAIRHGVITPARKRGANGRYLITREDALLLLAAALVAAAAGIAIVTALRGLRSAGATATSADSIVIPLGLGTAA